jgi:hypothetical protein
MIALNNQCNPNMSSYHGNVRVMGHIVSLGKASRGIFNFKIGSVEFKIYNKTVSKGITRWFHKLRTNLY